MARISINGVDFTVSGRSVSITNGTVTVDGSTVATNIFSDGDARIIWEGDLVSLKTDASVTCENVHGDVSVKGSLHCKDVQGSVSASGSVRCGKVGGSLNASGSVRIS